MEIIEARQVLEAFDAELARYSLVGFVNHVVTKKIYAALRGAVADTLMTLVLASEERGERCHEVSK